MGSWVNYGLGSESNDLARLRRADEPRRHARRRSRSPRGSGTAASCRASFQGVQFYSTGRSGPLRQQPAGRRPLAAAGRRRHRSAASTACATPRCTTPKSPRASPSTNWRSACRRACRSWSTSPSEPQHVLDMYGVNGRRRLVRLQLPARPPLAERGVRFIQLYHRDWDLHDGLDQHIDELCLSADQATRRADHRSQAARHARRHARRLGRRVRPHADGPGRRQRRRRRPRPSHPRLLDVARRRRHQARHHLRRDRRARLLRRREPGPRPRPARHDAPSAWASTTSGSPTATKAATSA